MEITAREFFESVREAALLAGQGEPSVRIEADYYVLRRRPYDWNYVLLQERNGQFELILFPLLNEQDLIDKLHEHRFTDSGDEFSRSFWNERDAISTLARIFPYLTFK